MIPQSIEMSNSRSSIASWFRAARWSDGVADMAKVCRTPPTARSKMTTMNLKGSWGYICPEYARTGKVGPGSDVYSLGVLLFELLSATWFLDLV